MTEIRDFHAHVYFDATTRDKAQALCEAARDRFSVAMGRMHERPIGPHPDWSCQLAFPPEKFGTVVPWLVLNRGGLSVLVHPETGDDLKDHTEHAMWLGQARPLDVSMFG